MIKNILFDMGDILIHFDRDAFLSRCSVSAADRELLRREVFLSVEWSMLDRGSLEEKEMLQIVCARLPEGLRADARRLVMEWDKPILPIDGMADLCRELKEAGYRLFLLSNASRRQHTYWHDIPGSSYFEDTLISADVRLVKPQPEIYRAAAEKFRIIPEESVFIDDNSLNVEGACCTGFHGIVFHQDPDELRSRLRELGVSL